MAVLTVPNIPKYLIRPKSMQVANFRLNRKIFSMSHILAYCGKKLNLS